METTSPAQPEAPKHRSSPKGNNSPPNGLSASRHERLCAICQHPRREDIDDDILRWRSPEDIACEFKLGDRSNVYRHGRATKLFSQRKQNLNPALERVIESVYDAKPTMNAALKAMSIYARVNGNEAYKAAFADPPRQTIITHVTVRDESATSSNASAKVPLYPEPPKDVTPSTDPASTAQNGLVGAPLAAPSSNPARSIHPDEGRVHPDFARTASTQSPAISSALGIIPGPTPTIQHPGSDLPPECPAGTGENVLTTVEPPKFDLEPENDAPSVVAEQRVTEDEPKIESFTSPLLPGVLFAEGFFPARERMRRIADRIIKVRPDLKDRFLFHSAVLIPLALLGWLVWSALLGAGNSAASASTWARSPWNANGSRFSSLPLRSSLSSTSHSFYSPQNLRPKNVNLLKTRGKAIFYSPQKHAFLCYLGSKRHTGSIMEIS